MMALLYASVSVAVFAVTAAFAASRSDKRGGASAYAMLAVAAMWLTTLATVPAAYLFKRFFTGGGGAYYAAIAVAAVIGVLYAAWCLRLRRGLRSHFERLLLALFGFAAVVAVFVTVGIVVSVLYESLQFFQRVPLAEFLFGLEWSPQIAIREGQVGATGKFGIAPLLTGTLLISAIAMLVATPIGFCTAAYMSEFAAKKTRDRIKPVLEILAGIPTIVYGFFAITVMSPWLVSLGESLQVKVAGENALAAGIVMGMLLIPFIASLTEDGFHAVPDSLRQGALGLGATRYEMTVQVIVPAALPGFVAGLLLAFSRAVGETMIVVMAAGISANLSLNPLEAITTMTVQIVTLLTGDQEFDDAKTLAAFALGLALFFITLLFNLIALRTVRKYQQRYE